MIDAISRKITPRKRYMFIEIVVEVEKYFLNTFILQNTALI